MEAAESGRPQEGRGVLSLSGQRLTHCWGWYRPDPMAHIALFARIEPLGFVRDEPPHATTISRRPESTREQLQAALVNWVSRVVADRQSERLREIQQGPSNYRNA